MPRNSGGVYSLPAGNPVVTGEVISSAWANSTLSDLATAMTGSLSNSGQGGMLAALNLFAGTIGTPGLNWTLEPTSGLYRAGAGDFRWAIGGVDVFTIGAGGISQQVLTLSGAAPRLKINETDAAANNRLWDITATAEQLQFRVVNDADNAFVNWLTIDRTLNVIDSAFLLSPNLTIGDGVFSPIGITTVGALTVRGATQANIILSEDDGPANEKYWRLLINGGDLQFLAYNDALTVANSFLTVARTGAVVDTVNIPNGALQYAGVEVGYRGMPQRTFAGNDTPTRTDRGTLLLYTGAGGNTLSINNSVFNADDIVTLVHAGSAGTLTIGGGITNMLWFNGSGAFSTGARTLALGGVVTLFMRAANTVYVWGTGIS